MKRLVLVIALVPSLALAEKTYSAAETSATHDCSKEPVATINASGGTFTFTGTCTKLGINGGKNTVTIEHAKKLGIVNEENVVEAQSVGDLGVNGKGNKVTVGAVKQVGVAGNDNAVTYKTGPGGKGRPKVAIVGKGNTVTQIKKK